MAHEFLTKVGAAGPGVGFGRAPARALFRESTGWMRHRDGGSETPPPAARRLHDPISSIAVPSARALT
jgi:hypothetical protein